MNAVPLPLVLTSCVLWLAAAPTTARAAGFRRGDDCSPGTRHPRAETAAEHCNAKRLASLDCAGLASHAESYRSMINQRLSSTYYRLVAESASAASPLPHLTPLPVSVPSVAPEPGPSSPGATPPVKP